MIGKIHTGRIDEINNGQAIAHGDFLRAQNLVNGFRPPGTGLHGGVVGDDYSRASLDVSDASDNPRARSLAIIFVVGDQQPDFQKQGSRINKFRHPFTRGELAILVLPVDFGGAAAHAQLVFQIVQVPHQLAHVFLHLFR